MSLPADERGLWKEYYDSAATALRMSVALSTVLEGILHEEGLSQAIPVQYRVKQWESVTRKIHMKTPDILSIRDITDLVGVRLVLLFRRDVERACEAIEYAFPGCDREETGERLADTEFGYRSVHYLITWPEQWLSVPGFQEFAGWQAEIQVRTLAEHLWAEVSHKLQYKQVAKAPRSVQRPLAQAAAAVEELDKRFEEVLSERDNYLSGLDNPQPDEPLNFDVLHRVLDQTLPPESVPDTDGYWALLDDLKAGGIETVGQLEDLISRRLDQVVAQTTEQFQCLAQMARSMPAYAAQLQYDLDSGRHLSHKGLVLDMLLADQQGGANRP